MSAVRLTRSLAQSLSRAPTRRPGLAARFSTPQCLTRFSTTAKDLEDPLMQEKSWWKRQLLKSLGFNSKASTMIRHANHMYDNCLNHSDDPKLVHALALDDEFVSRFELLSLHVWMCLARLRMDGADGAKQSQELFDNFWDDMMNEIRAKGVPTTAHAILSHDFCALCRQMSAGSDVVIR